jgi:hypothetical protein
VPPKPFEIVVGARTRKEDVDDEVAVILEDPLGVIVPFDGNGRFAAFLHLQIDLVADGLILPAVIAGADQKVIGEAGDLSKVKDDYVLSLFRVCRSNCGNPIRFSDFGGLSLQPVAWRLFG